MNINPNSSIARAVASARALCQTSQTFIDRLADGVNAVDRVYLFETEEAEQLMSIRSLRPFIVVGLSDDVGWDAVHPGCPNVQLETSGTVIASIVHNAKFTDLPTFAADGTTVSPGTDAHGDSYMDALNFHGGVIDDMDGRFGTAIDLIGFESVQLEQPPWRPEFSDRFNDDYWVSMFTFSFGDF